MKHGGCDVETHTAWAACLLHGWLLFMMCFSLGCILASCPQYLLQYSKLDLCGILLKRPCPRSWNLLSQACVMWLHPALPSSAPSLLVSGDLMWEKDKPRTSFLPPHTLPCFYTGFSSSFSSSHLILVLHDGEMWTFKALGVWQKILGCWTLQLVLFLSFLLKCQHGECVGQSGRACC